MPLLSICMPTYQRAERLQSTLDRWGEAITRGGWADRVEFCIADNASTDGTSEVINAFRPPGLAVTTFRQPENRGFSINLATAARLATGEYLLFAGDDDQPDSAIFPRIATAIEKGAAVCLFATLPDQPLSPADWPTRRNAREMADGEAVVRLLGIFHLTFIGNFIVRRTDYLAADDPGLTRSLYPHVGVLLRMLRHSPAWWVPEPLFEFGHGGTWNQPLLTALDLARVLTDELLIPANSKSLSQAVYARTVRSLPRVWANRKNGRPDEPGNPYRTLSAGAVLQAYRASVPYQGIALALWLAGAMIPASILRRLLGGKPRKVHFPPE